MSGLHSRLGYLLRPLARCERGEVRTNVDIQNLVHELSITRQDIRDILISFDSGQFYLHVFESFETRREQVESVEDEMNVPFTLLFLSCLVLSRRQCKPGIRNRQFFKITICLPFFFYLYSPITTNMFFLTFYQ